MLTNPVLYHKTLSQPQDLHNKSVYTAETKQNTFKDPKRRAQKGMVELGVSSEIHPQARFEKPVVTPAPRMAYPAVAAGMGHRPLGS